MPGRHPKLIEAIDEDNTRTRYTRAEIDARREHTPRVEGNRLRPPSWLDPVARKEWRRIVRLADKAELYSDLDANALGMYCMAYSRAVNAYAEYKKLEEKYRGEDDSRTVMVTSRGKTNPLLKLAMEAEEQCRKWSALLGLDPVARARMGLARKNNPDAYDPFEAFLNSRSSFLNGNDDE
jgi:P27 family predicted phage terminase small subunit